MSGAIILNRSATCLENYYCHFIVWLEMDQPCDFGYCRDLQKRWRLGKWFRKIWKCYFTLKARAIDQRYFKINRNIRDFIAADLYYRKC